MIFDTTYVELAFYLIEYFFLYIDYAREEDLSLDDKMDSTTVSDTNEDAVMGDLTNYSNVIEGDSSFSVKMDRTLAGAPKYSKMSEATDSGGAGRPRRSIVKPKKFQDMLLYNIYE